MDLINVFIIVGRGWTREKVERELIEEGYSHNFSFGDGRDEDLLFKLMEIANEIWCFGDCVGYNTLKYARSKGMDIWKMG